MQLLFDIDGTGLVSAVISPLKACFILFLNQGWSKRGPRGNGVLRGGGLFQAAPPPKKFRRPPQNRAKLNPIVKTVKKLLNLGRQHPKIFRKKVSKILKLPPVRSCFTLAMANKLVVVINSLKVPKIKKILLYEMKFLVPNYSCLQNP